MLDWVLYSSGRTHDVTFYWLFSCSQLCMFITKGALAASLILIWLLSIYWKLPLVVFPVARLSSSCGRCLCLYEAWSAREGMIFSLGVVEYSGFSALCNLNEVFIISSLVHQCWPWTVLSWCSEVKTTALNREQNMFGGFFVCGI